MSKSTTPAIGVADILCRTCKRDQGLVAKVLQATRWSFWSHEQMEEEVRREESRRLGVPLHKPRAYDVVLERFFAAARGIRPRRFTDESVWPRSLGMYCEYMETGKKDNQKWNAIDIEEVVDELERGGFAAELLGALWDECPEGYKAMGLPEPPGGGQDGKDVGLIDPIPVVGVVLVVGRNAGRSDKLADRMKRRNYPLVKIAGKWHCQRSDAIALFPRFKERIEEI